jgi:hypothetical protein
MSLNPPLERIPVGIIAERRRAISQWIDYAWRPVTALGGVPDTPPWTRLSGDEELALYYVGVAEVELYASEAPNYRDNLVSGTPQLWVALRPTDADPPYNLVAVTADPTEGEGYTQNGTDLVEPVPMPESIFDSVALFVQQHLVERVFFKRKRDRADPEALAPRGPARKDRSK